MEAAQPISLLGHSLRGEPSVRDGNQAIASGIKKARC